MKTVNFLTLNFLQKPVLISAVPDEYKAERVELFAHEFDKFDIICFQEIFEFWNPRAGRLIELAHQAGFEYFAKSPVCGYTSEFMLSAGLLIVSRYPISKSRFVPFTPCIHGDKYINKGVLWCQIDMPSGNKIHVFNTHALAYFSYLDHPTKVIGHVERVKEFLLIKRLIKEVLQNQVKHNDIAILCGDFNVNALNNKFPFEDVIKLINVSPAEREWLRTNNEFEFYKRVLEFKNEAFKVRNTYHEHHEEYPITNGLSLPGVDGKHKPVENLISDPLDRFDNSALDYILVIEDLVTGKTRPSGMTLPSVVPKSAKVEKFLVEHSFLTQLSDHFGISIKLNA